MRRFLSRLLERRLRRELPSKVIPPRSASESVYLVRWDVTGCLWAWLERLWRRRGWGALVHNVRRGDDDLALHSHPWSWAFAVILSGGYVEERLLPDGRVRARTLRPGRVMWLWSTDYHRIAELLAGESWSLFIHGPRTDTWYFRDRWTGKVCEWEPYLDAKASREVPPWR